MTMGDRIREARLAAGLTKTQLAVQCDCSLRTIDRWEQNDNRPLGKYLRDLASALGVTPESLQDPNGEPTKMVA